MHEALDSQITAGCVPGDCCSIGSDPIAIGGRDRQVGRFALQPPATRDRANDPLAQRCVGTVEQAEVGRGNDVNATGARACGGPLESCNRPRQHVVLARKERGPRQVLMQQGR